MNVWRGVVGAFLCLAASAVVAAVVLAFIYLPRLLPHPPTPQADAFNRVDTITVVLTAVTVILAALAIVVTLVGVIGYLQIKKGAEKVAIVAAERVARDTAGPVATREAERLIAALEPGTTSADADAIAGSQANGGRNAG
jgi:hypothetical protein